MSQTWPVGHDQFASESDPASLSPRTVLLSPPPFEDVEPEISRRISRGPGTKFRHERERVHSTASSRDLLHMLVSEEYESIQMRKILHTAFDRLEHETKRAETAEARIEQTVQRARAINEARIAAQQQAVRAQEELKLYKLQLDNAQNEILRAQDVLKAIEAQRDEAEAAAVSARSKARRLNEERLIDLAREEGRRLGFEEGVRRGRRMGYREAHEAEIIDQRDEAREVATAAVDRLLEARDEPEQIQVLEQATPIPPPPSSRTPEVHRLETPVNSSLESQRHSFRSRRDSPDTDNRNTPRRIPDPVILPTPAVVEPRIIPTGTTSIPMTANQASHPWAGPPSEPRFSRPNSTRNSPPNSEPSIPPDGYIPTADANHHISLPPPHVLQRNIPSPTPSQQTLGPGAERGRNRDYIYDNYPPPRRSSPDESLASTKQSAASTISQLDIVGLPTGRQRDRSQNLSVIHEDASMRSERMTDYSQTAASTSQAGRSSFRETRSNDTLRRDRKAKQQFADDLRYSDPSEAEQWRRQSDGSHIQQLGDGPPRHRPSSITTPAPLSPSTIPQQLDSRHRRTASERQGRLEMRGEHRDQRRPLSSDSSVPEINVEPPSGPSSDATSRGRGNVPASGLLSPDHAYHPLPVPAPSAPSVRSSPAPNSPVIPQPSAAGQIYTVLPNGQLPPGFLPSPTTDGVPLGPVMPNNMSGGVPPERHAAPYRASSERETGRSRSPVSFYAASPVPAGVTYPAPPVSRSAAYNSNSYPQNAGSNPSVTSDGRRRHDSLSTTAGMTPASRTKPIASTGSSTDDGGSSNNRNFRVPRRQSSASLTSQQSRPSYSRYDPNMYNDPAYLASNDSLMDYTTDANTAANGGGGGPVRPMRAHGSPGYSYATL